MKILCTADWHIGKKLGGFSRLDEQIQVLSEICTIAETEKPNAIIIAGDCFETTSPTPEQLRLFVHTLARLTRGGECPVLAIAGNHDSPLLLSSTEAFASQVGVVILGRPQDIPMLENAHSAWSVEASGEGMLQIYFKKTKKSVRFLLSPYADARRLKKDLGTEDTDIKAWEILQNQWKEQINPEVFNILVAHSTVREEQNDLYVPQELEEDEGEKKIGGINAVPLENLPEGIDFMILGHIHSAQKLNSSKTQAFYTGSPLIYSQNEVKKKKSLLMIELNEKKSHHLVPLSPYRDIKKVVLDSMDDAIAKLEAEHDHFVEVIWTAPRFLEGFERRQLDEAHPRILNILSSLYLSSNQEEIPVQSHEYSPELLFHEYFSHSQQGREAPESIIKLFLQFSSNISSDNNPKKRGFLPKMLTIEGFFSYKNRISIDFSDFGMEGIFGIFGEVGSGKSALIEAIILALFSVTERVPRKKTDSQSYPPGYNVMNLDSDSLFIDFSFEIIGENGVEIYKIVLSAKRGKKSEESLKINRDVFLKNEEEWIPVDPIPDGETLLGITYDDFRKTVILQQRDFMGFIEAKPTENAEMLQRLFRLDRYDLAPAIKEYLATLEAEQDILTRQLEDLSQATPERKIALEEESISLDNQLEELRKELKALREAEKKRVRHQEQEKNRNSLLSEEQELGSVLEKMENHIRVISPQLEEYSPKIAQFDVNIAQIDERLAQIQPQLDEENPNLARDLSLLEDKTRRIDEKNATITQLFVKIGFKTLEEIQSYGKKLRLDKNTLEEQVSVEKGLARLQDGKPCPLCGSIDHPSPCPPDPARRNKLTKITQEIEDLLGIYNKIEDCLSDIKRECGEYSLESLKDQIKSLKSLIDEQNKRVSNLKIEKKNLENSKNDCQQAIRMLENERSQKEKQLLEYQTTIKLSQKRLEDVQTKLAELPPLPEIIEDPQSMVVLADVEALEADILQRQGALQRENSLISEQLKQKESLLKKMEDLKVSIDEASIMEKLFKAKGFVKFVAHKHLSRLCHAANKRFSAFTNGRFLLKEPETPEKGLVLIDILNGGRQRDLSTLSGGQSFQAALALSASLADESGTGGRFFFIDEGFGSLDDTSLDAVMDTLSHLVKENHRLIGVISHVGSLHDRLESYINVSMNPKSGSSIEVVLS
ncbi:MAG: exonuclease subunit SbcD [Brevinema sp.]